METMQFPITTGLKTFVENQAAKNGFSSPGDYLHSLLLDLEKRERAKYDLEEKLREGLRSPLIDADEAFWRELEREIFDEHPELKTCEK